MQTVCFPSLLVSPLLIIVRDQVPLSKWRRWHWHMTVKLLHAWFRGHQLFHLCPLSVPGPGPHATLHSVGMSPQLPQVIAFGPCFPWFWQSCSVLVKYPTDSPPLRGYGLSESMLQRWNGPPTLYEGHVLSTMSWWHPVPDVNLQRCLRPYLPGWSSLKVILFPFSVLRKGVAKSHLQGWGLNSPSWKRKYVILLGILLSWEGFFFLAQFTFLVIYL